MHGPRPVRAGRSWAATCRSRFGSTSEADRFPSAAKRKPVGLTATAVALAGRSLAALLRCPGRHAKHRAHNAVSWPDEVTRPSVFRRSRARTVWFVTVSAVCDRRNEREHPAKAAELSAAASEAGGKLPSPSPCAGRTVPTLARGERVRRLRLSPTKRWRRLGEAGLGHMSRSEATRLPIHFLSARAANFRCLTRARQAGGTT